MLDAVDKLSKISVELTTDNETINKVLDNPLIYQMVNGTPYTKPFNTSFREELTSQGFKFLGIHSHNSLIRLNNHKSLIGLFSYREVSKICIEAHIHILPEAHKKGYGKEAVTEGLKYFKSIGAHKIVTYVPMNCSHVLKFMKDNDFEACGSISEAIIYNNELVSLFVFTKGL